MITNLRTGFKITAMMLGLVALAFLATNFLVGSGTGLSLAYFNSGSTIADVIFLAVIAAVFPLACMGFAAIAGRPNLRNLFDQPAKHTLLALFFFLGALLAFVISNPLHDYLIRTFLPKLDGAADAAVVIQDSVKTAFFICEIILVALIVPVSEEFVDRGVLFKELEALPRWQIVLWSILVFSFSHYLVFGIFKVIAVVPMAVVFSLIRLRFGTWKYSAAAHAGVNAFAALAGPLGV